MSAKKREDLAEDLHEFRKTGEGLADVTLVCQEKRLPAHKAILALRSKVFRTMFTLGDTREAATKEVIIDDADPETVERFLE